MFNSKKIVMTITLLVLMAAIPAMALEGMGKFVVSAQLFVGGQEIKPGEYDVKWESHSPEATVTFISKGKVALKVEGKVEELNRVSDYNSLAIGKDSAGREAIKGLQFGGKKVRIIFE
jgi:hypothetical protein